MVVESLGVYVYSPSTANLSVRREEEIPSRSFPRGQVSSRKVVYASAWKPTNGIG